MKKFTLKEYVIFLGKINKLKTRLIELKNAIASRKASKRNMIINGLKNLFKRIGGILAGIGLPSGVLAAVMHVIKSSVSYNGGPILMKALKIIGFGVSAEMGICVLIVTAIFGYMAANALSNSWSEDVSDKVINDLDVVISNLNRMTESQSMITAKLKDDEGNSTLLFCLAYNHHLIMSDIHVLEKAIKDNPSLFSEDRDDLLKDIGEVTAHGDILFKQIKNELSRRVREEDYFIDPDVVLEISNAEKISPFESIFQIVEFEDMLEIFDVQ